MKLVDSTVVIDYLRGHTAASQLLDSAIMSFAWVGASEIVRFEVLAGARDHELPRIDRFLSALGWVAIEEPIARRAGELARRYGASHGGIDDADYLIAATAITLGAQLLTTNVRRFPMLAGLEPAY